MVREALVETGSTTRVDMPMQIGTTTEVVQVEAATSQITYDSYKVDGVITRQQIQELPLNGRSFLQLAFLEPGVTVSPQSTAQYNAQFSVSVLGGAGSRTAIMVDGGNVRNSIEGGTGQNFSQEVVQEFQLSSVNFDLSTPITSVGAVNIVTRTGGNEFHGSGYFFFRDHNMAAYPALRRNAFNPDPFFARRQSGMWFGGPIKKDKFFFFFNIEHLNQDSVVTIQPNAPSLAAFAQNATSPYTGKQLSQRFDYRLSANHTLFARYSHDGNNGFGPAGGAPMPSNWLKNTNWSDQSILGLTSAIRASLVNDFRFAYQYWRNRNLFPSESDCPGCIGRGLAQIQITGTNFTMGNTSNATQGRDLRRFNFTDNLTWQKGSHRLRFGGEFEYAPGTGFWGFCDPACIVLYSPELVAQINPLLPAPARVTIPGSFRTEADLLQLPLAGWSAGIGDLGQPPQFQIDKARFNRRYRYYLQDSWRIKPRFTLTYGVAWEFEEVLANHDIDKPAYLTAILGAGGLKATKRDPNNYSPTLGFAWGVTKDNKTVIRGGAGIYYDTALLWQRLQERSSIGPRGTGRVLAPGALVPNPIPGFPTVPVGTPLEFVSFPTPFTAANLLSILTPARAGLEAGLRNPNPNDLSVRNIDVFKSGSNLMPYNYPTMYGQHVNLGVQRELRRDLVLTADFVLRQFRNDRFEADHNRWNNSNGSVIPRCTGTQSSNPAIVCSGGPITFNTPAGRSTYKALLVKVDKRFSNRYQFTASYALQDQVQLNGIVNNTNWFQSYGPSGSRHILTISGVVDLPWKVQASFISYSASRGPLMPSIPTIDLDGDGLNGEPLPGAKFNGFNRGLGKEDLRRLVDEFNTKYAGTRTPRNQTVPRLTLPADFTFGDPFSSQDLRVTKTFAFRERYKLNIFAEIFNVFNIANLSGFNFNLSDPGSFGIPTQRASQVFGSGGPRAYQLAARFSF